MDVTCPNCGAANRDTSHFCARCGELLPRPDTEVSQSPGDLDLPWLQAVQDKAARPTGNLTDEQIARARAQEQIEAALAASPGHEAGEAPPTPGGSTEGATEQAPAGPTNPPDEAPPPWVVGILEPSAAAPAGHDAYEPEELAHIMPWTTPIGEVPAAPGDSTEARLPPWLNNVTVQETLQAAQHAGEEPQLLPDLDMEGIEPFIPPDAVAAEARPMPAAREEVPEWLQGIGGEAPASAAPPQQKFPTLTQLTAEPASSLGETRAHEKPVRSPRPGAVQALAALLQPATAEAGRRVVTAAGARGLTAEAGTLRRGLSQWLFPDGLIYVLVLAPLLAILILRLPFGDTAAPAARGVQEFYDQIERVPTNKPVVVVYDWDATRSAEMSDLSRAVMSHLMSRRISFVTISTVPQGPGFAQQIIASLRDDRARSGAYKYQYGTDYLIFGYLPGNEAALRALSGGFSKVLPVDYQDGRNVNSFPIMQSGKLAGISDFALIIDLASEEADLRNWVEQISSRTNNVPMLAAVPQALEPLARPYENVPGTGLKAVISGPTGAMQYNRQLGLSATGSTQVGDKDSVATRLNAQSVAQILVALVIVAAFISRTTARILRR